MTTETEVLTFNIATHNGCLTLVSPTSGEHRTIRIRTQPKDSGFAPGKRVIQLLTGPDNTSDYRTFGFVSDFGRISLFKKHQSERFYQWMQRYLENPARSPKVQFHFEGTCRRCNRQLTDPLSCELGIGPTCRGQD